MNAKILCEVARRTLAGTVSFPEIVRELHAAGVESYRVDYVTRTKTWYGEGGEVAVTPIPLENLPPIEPELDVSALRQNVRDSQTAGQVWKDFTFRAMAAGVANYTVYLRGRRVVYCGRQGDEHVEWFPGAGPMEPATASRG
ncbi:MAG: DUF1398 family protein [Planctomycetota bacterium]